MAPMCTTCKIVIRWQPTMVDGQPYCCLGCARGGPCECDYDNLPHPGDASALALRQREQEHTTDEHRCRRAGIGV